MEHPVALAYPCLLVMALARLKQGSSAALLPSPPPAPSPTAFQEPEPLCPCLDPDSLLYRVLVERAHDLFPDGAYCRCGSSYAISRVSPGAFRLTCGTCGRWVCCHVDDDSLHNSDGLTIRPTRDDDLRLIDEEAEEAEAPNPGFEVTARP